MAKRELLYLSQADVLAINLSMREIIDAIEEAFRLKGEGLIEMPPKPGIHPRRDAFIHAMPAYIRGKEAAGIKWVSGYPQNQERGLPYMNGLLILNDADTGLPICVMDCVWVTAMRTGAATAVAAKYLARPDSRSVGILGCGVQGRTNLLALRELFDLETVHAYDKFLDIAERYAKEMSRETGLAVKSVDQPRKAVVASDIIVTAGPILLKPHATIKADWIPKGAFASPVDFDSYWSREALARATRFCTDDREQFHYYQTVGYFKDTPPIYAELGEIASGKKAGRESPREINICMNLGLAMDDIAVAPLIYERAVKRRVGTWLPL